MQNNRRAWIEDFCEIVAGIIGDYDRVKVEGIRQIRIDNVKKRAKKRQELGQINGDVSNINQSLTKYMGREITSVEDFDELMKIYLNEDNPSLKYKLKKRALNKDEELLIDRCFNFDKENRDQTVKIKTEREYPGPFLKLARMVRSGEISSEEIVVELEKRLKLSQIR